MSSRDDVYAELQTRVVALAENDVSFGVPGTAEHSNEVSSFKDASTEKKVDFFKESIAFLDLLEDLIARPDPNEAEIKLRNLGNVVSALEVVATWISFPFVFGDVLKIDDASDLARIRKYQVKVKLPSHETLYDGFREMQSSANATRRISLSIRAFRVSFAYATNVEFRPFCQKRLLPQLVAFTHANDELFADILRAIDDVPSSSLVDAMLSVFNGGYVFRHPSETLKFRTKMSDRFHLVAGRPEGVLSIFALASTRGEIGDTAACAALCRGVASSFASGIPGACTHMKGEDVACATCVHVRVAAQLVAIADDETVRVPTSVAYNHCVALTDDVAMIDALFASSKNFPVCAVVTASPCGPKFREILERRFATAWALTNDDRLSAYVATYECADDVVNWLVRDVLPSYVFIERPDDEERAVGIVEVEEEPSTDDDDALISTLAHSNQHAVLLRLFLLGLNEQVDTLMRLRNELQLATAQDGDVNENSRDWFWRVTELILETYSKDPFALKDLVGGVPSLQLVCDGFALLFERMSDVRDGSVEDVVLSMLSVLALLVFDDDYKEARQVVRENQKLLDALLALSASSSVAVGENALVVRLHVLSSSKPRRRKRTERSNVQHASEMENHLDSDEIPIRAMGVDELASSLMALESFDAALFSRLIETLEDEDSYVFLTTIKAIARASDLFPSEIVDALCDEILTFRDEDSTRDDLVRLVRVGESLNLVCTRRGDALPVYCDRIVPVLAHVSSRSFPQDSGDEDAQLVETFRASSLGVMALVCDKAPVEIVSNHAEAVVGLVKNLLRSSSERRLHRGALLVLLSVLDGISADVIGLLPPASSALKGTKLVLETVLETRSDDDVVQSRADGCVERMRFIVQSYHGNS